MAKNSYSRCARCPTKVCENRGGKVSDKPLSLEKAPAGRAKGGVAAH